MLIFCGTLFEPFNKSSLEKLHINRQGVPWRVWQTVRTIILVNFGELFFRAHGLMAGLSMFKRIWTDFKLDAFVSGDYLVGIDSKDLIVVVAGVVFVLIFSILHERCISVREVIAGQKLPVRWLCYYGLILLIIIFGAYGQAYSPVDPIYAGF